MKSVHKEAQPENSGNKNTEKSEKCVDNETSIKCNACEEVFNSNGNLDYHTKNNHEEKINNASAIFEGENSDQVHLNKEFNCNQCSY